MHMFLILIHTPHIIIQSHTHTLSPTIPLCYKHTLTPFLLQLVLPCSAIVLALPLSLSPVTTLLPTLPPISPVLALPLFLSVLILTFIIPTLNPVLHSVHVPCVVHLLFFHGYLLRLVSLFTTPLLKASTIQEPSASRMSILLTVCLNLLFLHNNTCTCTCNSCLMVFTVHGICTARGLYVLPRAESEEVHTVRGRYISHAL